MSFVDALFPKMYSYGSNAGPAWKVEVVSTQNGHEKRNLVYHEGRRIYNLSFTPRTRQVKDDIIAFHAAMHGPWSSFRFWDFADNILEDEIIGEGDGSNREFQVVKAYRAGSAVHVRNIDKIATGLIVKVDNVPAAHSIDLLTGIITLNSAPAGGKQVSVSGEFHVAVRFVEEKLTWTADAPDLFSPESLTLIEVLGE